MAITIPLQNHPVVQTAWKIFKIEASQLSLPDSKELMQSALIAYALMQAGSQMFDHSAIGAVIYGLVSAGFAYGATLFLMRFLKQEDKFTRTVIAIAGTGAIGALAYILLHMFFALALPPPLPTERLVKFLLAPIIVWYVFIYAFYYRHVDLRPIPAFVVAAFYVLIVQVVLSVICK